MITNYINTYFKRISSYIIALILVLVSVLPTMVLYTKTISHNKAMAESMRATGHIAFELLNEILSVSENLISENKEFFLKSDTSETEYIEMSNRIKDIKNNCSYVERIVFYKKDDSRLLTDNGTIHKDDFFGSEYRNEQYNTEYWNNLLSTYQPPAIIPAAEYETTGENVGAGRRIFIVPNIYYIYNVGALFFVNEDKFIEYCGFNTNKDCNIAFYNLKGEYIFGNGSAKSLKGKPLKEDSVEKLSLFGNYELASRFKYNDMIFQVKTKNRLVPFVIFITLIGNIVALMLILEITRRRRANIAAVTDSGIGIQTMLYACMKNRELLAENENLLNQAITTRNDSSFALYALIFADLADKRRVPEPKKANGKLPNSVMAIEKKGNALILFANIPLSKTEIADKFMESEVSELVESVGAESYVVRGGVFSDLAELPAAYSRLRQQFLLFDKGLDNGAIVIPEINSMKRELSQYIIEGKISAFISKLRDEIKIAGEKMPYNMYVYYLVHLYFFVADILERKTDFINDTFVLFAEGIRTSEHLFNAESATNILLNILTNIKEYIDAKPEDTEKMKEILGYINQNYSRDIGLDEIAEYFGMKTKTLSAFFKRKTGAGFLEYLTRLRMEEAKRLLLETDKPVKEILIEVGYISNSTFTMMFKKHVGKSPLQFRNDSKNKSKN